MPLTESGFLAFYDVALTVEVENDRWHLIVRAHFFGYSALSPVLVLGAGSMKPKHDQISVEVGERITNRRDRILNPNCPMGLQVAPRACARTRFAGARRRRRAPGPCRP